ncbi:MAG: alpha/beta fold hydrolase [Gammaproteobacteria bacterium]|nr:alpha/beta fold hydrolase [Gammaproteobacteria bacterium]NNJ98318.1 alpha/beta fold hydrolase [Gammaproteobacteria bacterium]
MLSRVTAFIIALLPSVSPADADYLMHDRHASVVDIALADITLVGRYFEAERTGRGPAILLLHGWSWPENDPSWGMISAAVAFQRAGFTVLVPSMRGWPPSGGEDDCAGKQVEDVLQLLEWLGQQSGVDAGKLFLAGFSQGGQVALLAATHDAPVQALAAFAPVVQPGSWGEDTNVEGIRDYVMEECGGPDGWPLRDVMFRASRVQRPLLLVHGDADRRVPTQQSTRLYQKLTELQRPVTLKLIAGAGHDQDKVLQSQLAIDFFRSIIGTF